MSAQTPRVALITGGIAGIGRATANLLTAEGYRVFVTSRSHQQGVDASGIEVLKFSAESDQSATDCVAALIDKTGRIDVLINNIGTGMLGAAEEQSIAEGEHILQTNFWGAVRMIKSVLPIMRAQGGGRIISMSSVGGLLGFPYSAFYSASKFALEGYCDALQLEVKPFGIHVSLVEPAGVLTPVAGNVPKAALTLPPYAQTRTKMGLQMDKMMKAGMPAETVAMAIKQILEKANPKLHYKVGTPARILGLILRLAPEPVLIAAKRRLLNM
jgi:NAD(P)-dependent dehydrogenase (short-subunit alcohol dehydrogenase family)